MPVSGEVSRITSPKPLQTYDATRLRLRPWPDAYVGTLRTDVLPSRFSAGRNVGRGIEENRHDCVRCQALRLPLDRAAGGQTVETAINIRVRPEPLHPHCVVFDSSRGTRNRRAVHRAFLLTSTTLQRLARQRRARNSARSLQLQGRDHQSPRLSMSRPKSLEHRPEPQITAPTGAIVKRIWIDKHQSLSPET